MATISTVLKLVDYVSTPLKNVKSSVDQTTKGFESFAGKLVSVNSAIQLISTATNMLKRSLSGISQYVSMYQIQIENETRLESVMRRRMNATQEDIDLIKKLASAEQQRGIYGDEMILQGAQQLSIYLSNRKSLEQLIPVMNNLVAQQKGFSASAGDMQNAGKILGKAIAGQADGLSRFGIVLSDDQKKMIQLANEEQRVAIISKIITDRVSEMNEALANTGAGSMAQLRNAIGDFKEQIGGILEPVVVMFNKIQMAIIEKFREPILNAIQSFVDYLPTLLNGLLNIATVIVSVGAIWGTVWAVMNWPITLAIAGIVMLGNVIYNMTGDFATAGEIIGGIIGGIVTTFKDVYVIIYNIIADLTNLVAGFIEFFVNVWKHPVVALRGLFTTIFDFIFGLVQKVTNVLDSIFGTKFSQSLQNQRDKLLETQAKAEEGKDMFKIERMQQKEVSGIIEGVKSGAVTGKTFETWIRTKLSEIAISTKTVSSAVNSSGNIDVEPQGEIKIDDDYKSLLAEQAVRQYQLSYASITPDFSIQNVNVSNEADVDTIFERIADKIAELTQTYIKKEA